jgi:hypothetical protein
MRLVSREEAAYVLNVSYQTIWNLCVDGQLKALKFSETGHHYIDLATFLKERNIDPKPFFEHLDQRQPSRSKGRAPGSGKKSKGT